MNWLGGRRRLRMKIQKPPTGGERNQMSDWTTGAIQFALVAAILAWGVGVFGTADSAMADELTDVEVDDTEIASLEEGPIVRRQLLHRASRFEVQPSVLFTLNDAYVRNGIAGLSGRYFLNNSFGFGASAGVGVLQLDTNLRSHLESELEAGGPDDWEDETSFSEVGFIADFGLIWVPAFGKMSVMNSLFSHYDFNVTAGMGFVHQRAETASGNGDPDAELEGLQPAPMFGAGLRFFVSDRTALNFELRNYLNFSHAEISQGDADPRLGLMSTFSVGVGFFFPGDVHISR